MKNLIGKRMTILLLIAVLFFSLMGNFHFSAMAKDDNKVETARPSVNGRLHVDGQNLVDENGDVVQLRGVSTHGLTWFPGFLNNEEEKRSYAKKSGLSYLAAKIMLIISSFLTVVYLLWRIIFSISKDGELFQLLLT